ncbi:MAG TPA: ATP-grasp domain-containing protein [Candidatus Acidoferrum sp.]|nr:ATP-grasp domain-containing protein [Candidatus Acidoferrum sp.]
MAMSNAGFTVEAVCPPGHSLGLTSVVQRTYDYSGLSPLRSFTAAIVASKPDLVVPTNDYAVQYLHRIHAREKARGKPSDDIARLIEHSLGDPASFLVVYARAAFMQLAQEEGVRVPQTKRIESVEALNDWISEGGLPTVLKADRTSGGEGVRIARNRDEALKAFKALQAPPLLARAVKRAVFDQDKTLLLPSINRNRSIVNGQAFIGGREATSLITCWKGAVLASLHFEVVNKQNASGPATVLRLIENADMTSATEKIAKRLNLSGLHGFDYMIEDRTSNAYLIELNPRATQVGHLALGPGRDLAAALFSASTGATLHESAKLTDNDTIALFPQEWLRNPDSSFLQSGYHDVPWGEPALIRACMRSRRKRGLIVSEQEWIRAFSGVRPPPR